METRIKDQTTEAALEALMKVIAGSRDVREIHSDGDVRLHLSLDYHVALTLMSSDTMHTRSF